MSASVPAPDLTVDPRTTAPQPLPSHSALHGDILSSWVASRPSAGALHARQAALEKVRRAVATYSAGGATAPSHALALFGSVAIGVDDGSSDLDLCILDPDRPSGRLEQAARRKGIYDVYLLGNKLTRAGLTSVVPIANASTPIVKCRDPTSLIELDISINNLGAICNTRLIEAYCSLSPYALRPLLHAVKKWGKARAVASQSTQQATFSSYGLNLLCIAYLQGTSPPGSADAQGFLPNLQDSSLIEAFNVPPSQIFIRKNRRGKEVVNTAVDVTFVPVRRHASGGAHGGAWGMPSDEVAAWRARNSDVDLGALLLGFYRFYAAADGRGWSWDREGASVRYGGWVHRSSAAGLVAFADIQDQESQPMLIQDPFLLSKNCALPIKPCVADEIRAEFQRAAAVVNGQAAGSLQTLCAPYAGPSPRAVKKR